MRECKKRKNLEAVLLITFSFLRPRELGILPEFVLIHSIFKLHFRPRTYFNNGFLKNGKVSRIGNCVVFV